MWKIQKKVARCEVRVASKEKIKKVARFKCRESTSLPVFQSK